MKTTFRYLAAAFTVIAAVSCAKHEEFGPQEENTVGTYQYLLNVSHENDDTKTTMDGVNILWKADDKIAVMGIKDDGTLVGAKNSGGAQSIQVDDEGFTPSTSAIFALNLTEGVTPLAATYPYHEANSLEYQTQGEENTLACRFFIPAEQTGVKDDLPLDAFPMVGRIVNGNCKMYNAGALIKFDIVNTDIVSIKFEGNAIKGAGKYDLAISGRNYYYVDNGEFTRGTGNSAETVTLTPQEGKTVFETGSYYFAVAPRNLENGFTMTVTDRFGKQAVRKTSTPFNIQRNHKYTKFGSDEGWFKNLYTASAGNLASADGSTATLYGVIYGDLTNEKEYGFETSTDGTNWGKLTGDNITLTSSNTGTDSQNLVNTISAEVSGIPAGAEYFYRAYCIQESGITTYGKVKSFKTVAGNGAENVKINLYNAPIQWPFSNLGYNTADDVEGLKMGTANAARYAGVLTTLTLKNDDNSFDIMATGGMWLNLKNAGLTIKGKKGDYIKLPVIKGKKPVSVSIVYGAVQNSDITSVEKDHNNQGLLSVNKIIDGNSGIITGGDKWNPIPVFPYDSHIWELEDTDDGQYELFFNATAETNCYIAYLEVNYINHTASDKPESIVNNLVFSTRTGDSGRSTNWPFAQTWASYKTQQCPTPVFYTASHPELTYQFYIAGLPTGDLPSDGSQKFKEDWWRQTSGAGLSWGSEAGDYMAILPVSEYKVTCIKIRNSNKTPTYYLAGADNSELTYTITKEDGTELNKPYTASGTADEMIVFNLSDSTPNTEYRLTVGGPLNKNGVITPGAIREMWITYELVK